MYSVDARDSVVELSDVPQCCTGAPHPFLICEENFAALFYSLNNAADDHDDQANYAIIRFDICLARYLGPPNDEAIMGHPLWERGLRAYAAFEIEESSWLRGLARVNRVHPRHSPSLFEGYRHFIFTFHDTTFECIADAYRVKTLKGSLRDAQAEALGIHGAQ